MNFLDSTSYRTKQNKTTNTLNKFQYIFLTTDIVFDKTRCIFCFSSIEKAVKNNVVKYVHFNPEKLFEAPPSSRLDFWRLLPGFEVLPRSLILLLRPRAIFVLGVHRGPLRKQSLHLVDVAFARRLVQRRSASGAFSRNPSGPLWASGGRRPTRGDGISGPASEARTVLVIHRDSSTHQDPKVAPIMGFS